MSRIKEARLAVEWLGCEKNTRFLYQPGYRPNPWCLSCMDGDTWVGRWFSDADISTLAAHGIVKIVEDEVQPTASPVCPRCKTEMMDTVYTVNGWHVWTCECRGSK